MFPILKEKKSCGGDIHQVVCVAWSEIFMLSSPPKNILMPSVELYHFYSIYRLASSFYSCILGVGKLGVVWSHGMWWFWERSCSGRSPMCAPVRTKTMLILNLDVTSLTHLLSFSLKGAAAPTFITSAAGRKGSDRMNKAHRHLRPSTFFIV